VTAIIAVAVALRLPTLGQPQLFRDEAESWYVAIHPLSDVLRLSANETFPPLYPLLLKGWIAAFGDSEGTLRAISVLSGLGTVAVTWRWARSALGEIGALTAAVVVAVAPAMVMADRDARMYSPETLFSTVGWWLAWTLVAEAGGWSGRGRLAAMIGLALAVAGEVWTMSLGLPVMGLQLAFALTVLLWLRRRRVIWAVGGIVIGALSFVPWVPSLISVATNDRTFWTPRPDLSAIRDTLSFWIAGRYGGLLWIVVWLAAGAAVLGVMVALFDRPIRRPSPNAAPNQAPHQPTNAASDAAADTDLAPGPYPAPTPELHTSRVGCPEEAARPRLLALALIVGLGLAPAVWAYSQVHSIYDARYLGSAFPPFAIAIGSAAAWLARVRLPSIRLARSAPARLRVAATVVVVVAMAGGMAIGSRTYVADSATNRDIEPARQVVATLSELARPGDVIVALNAQTYFPLAYYLRDGALQRKLGTGLYDWHRASAAFYTGWMDIDAAALLEPTEVARAGWQASTHLGSKSSVWLVSLVNAQYEFSSFEPLSAGTLVQTDRIDLPWESGVAQIRRAVPRVP
jgi:4-amino-4-deoxy-L-arabinose transferase-like glycosyltransferase